MARDLGVGWVCGSAGGRLAEQSRTITNDKCLYRPVRENAACGSCLGGMGE